MAAVTSCENVLITFAQCNCETCMTFRKCPSEQLSQISVFADYLFKEETIDFYSRECFVIFKLNLLPKLKKTERPQNGTGYYKIIKRINV